MTPKGLSGLRELGYICHSVVIEGVAVPVRLGRKRSPGGSGNRDPLQPNTCGGPQGPSALGLSNGLTCCALAGFVPLYPHPVLLLEGITPTVACSIRLGLLSK